jgi:hypothetical protein
MQINVYRVTLLLTSAGLDAVVINITAGHSSVRLRIDEEKFVELDDDGTVWYSDLSTVEIVPSTIRVTDPDSRVAEKLLTLSRQFA